jgi:hypothetical protein
MELSSPINSMMPSLAISRDERKSFISSDGSLNKKTSLHFPLEAMKSNHIDLKLFPSAGNKNTRTRKHGKKSFSYKLC